MLHLCSNCDVEIDIHFNPKRFRLFQVGKSFKDNVVDLHIDVGLLLLNAWVDTGLSLISWCLHNVCIMSRYLKFDKAVYINS